MYTPEELQFTRSINDPIHGQIRMTEEEHALMDSPVYQRLRGIKQNGFLYLVFPAATHTRFEHSLGAMHMAEQMLGALHANSEAEYAKSNKRLPAHDLGRPGQAINYARVDRSTRTCIRRVVRLAALIHDMGHGPLSHSFEHFAPKVRQLQTLVPDDHLLVALRDVLLPKAGLDKPVEHEALSCLMLAWHWKNSESGANAADRWIPIAVAIAVLGRKWVPKIPAAIPDFMRPWMALIQDIIASAPVDADRLDYVERDSRSAGVNYGLYDRDRLLKSALCYRYDKESYRLGWKISGLRAIEVFIHARFQLFAQIYYHKTCRAADVMMEDIQRVFHDNNITIFEAQSEQKLIEEYCELSDERFLAVLCGNVSGKLQGPEQVHEIARRIAKRNLYKKIYEGVKDASAQSVKAFMNVAPKLEPEIKSSDSSTKATKDLKNGAVLLRRDEEGLYTAPTSYQSKGGEENWLEASAIMKALHDEDLQISRLYYSGQNEDNCGALRDEARRIASTLLTAAKTKK